MNRTFKATVTLGKSQLAKLICWAVKNKCSGGLTFGANLDDDTARMEVSVEEARAAIAATADLPSKRKSPKRIKSSARPLVRTASGAIDINPSLLSLGLSRSTLLRRNWKQGSNPHRLKAAIRCGWREALKAKNAHAYRDSNGKRSRDMGPTYSTKGNIMGKAEMRKKGLKDTSKA
jgi:hypothetical protein